MSGHSKFANIKHKKRKKMTLQREKFSPFSEEKLQLP